MDTNSRSRTCCFSGHRRISSGDISTVREKINEKVEFLVINNKVQSFLFGGSYGFDMEAFNIVYSLKEKYPHIKLYLALPCCDQSAKWNGKLKKEYECMLKKADDCIYVSDESYFDGCMKLRNNYMVDQSLYCICYLQNKKSGTWQTVKYAMDNNLTVYNILDMVE